MDGHLQALAKKYFKTKFMKVDVEKAGFLVARLQVKMLPCLILFVDAIAVDRYGLILSYLIQSVVGFEELGNTDKFPTLVLEKRLSKSGVLMEKKVSLNAGKFSIKHKGIQSSSYSSKRNVDGDSSDEN